MHTDTYNKYHNSKQLDFAVSLFLPLTNFKSFKWVLHDQFLTHQITFACSINKVLNHAGMLKKARLFEPNCWFELHLIRKQIPKLSENVLQDVSPIFSFKVFQFRKNGVTTFAGKKMQSLSPNFVYFIYLFFERYWLREKFWVSPLKRYVKSSLSSITIFAIFGTCIRKSAGHNQLRL